jgi:hypothetical protein
MNNQKMMKTDEKTGKTSSKTQKLQEIFDSDGKRKISCSKQHQIYHQLFRPCPLFWGFQGLTPGFFFFFCYLSSRFLFCVKRIYFVIMIRFWWKK